MILGVGVDICEIARIAKLLSKNKEQFSKRVLAEGESCKGSAAAYAKRFAAKEAVSKALGTGIGHKLSFHDIKISHYESGQPYATLSQNAMAHFGDVKLHLSLSDEAGLAVAYVVAENV